MKYTDDKYLLFRHVLTGWAGVHRLRVLPPENLYDLLCNARAEGAAEALEACGREFAVLFKPELDAASGKKFWPRLCAAVKLCVTKISQRLGFKEVRK